MKWLFNLKREILCLGGAIGAFWLTNKLAAIFMPTEGVNSSFYLIIPALALYYAFSVGLIGWFLFGALFPSGDRYIDAGEFKMDFQSLEPKWKVIITLAGVTLCMFVSLACLLIAALP
jgi:hypothetical protein